jgi:two-component system cell cycle response regulator CpdR
MSAATMRVLIAEDDDAVRGFLTKALERGGWESVGVHTGEEAFDLVRADPSIAVVLIDGLLPDMHGVRVADRLLDHEAGRDVAICFVSGAIREHQMPEAGVAALSKPVRLAELLAAVSSLIEWRRGVHEPVERRRAVVRRLEQGFLVGP